MISICHPQAKRKLPGNRPCDVQTRLRSARWFVAIGAGIALACAPALAFAADPSLSAGFDHTCALKSGSVFCWGSGLFGYLGYGDSDDIGDNESPGAAGPVPVGGTVVQISAGYDHTCALLTGGNVRCWGENDAGQLGYGNTDNVGVEDTPASVGDVDVGGSVAQIAAGDGFTCALLTTGSVRCWGDGHLGHLGYGNTLNVGDVQPPATAGNLNLGAPATQIAVGAHHACALLSGGSVRCWGENDAGQLGYGNSNNVGDNEMPSSLPAVNVGGTVTQISAGEFQTCALLSGGSVRCWGGGDNGELGYGNLNDVGDNEIPASLGTVNVGGRVVQISAGSEHTCALLDTGNVRCWGSGAHGELGYGNQDDIGDNEPAGAAGDINLGATASAISVGGEHTCALLSTSAIRCWGHARFGQLGYGNERDIGDDELPVAAGDVSLEVAVPVSLPLGARLGSMLGLLALGASMMRPRRPNT